jgi:hypothetical protein
MTKTELLQCLAACVANADTEDAHYVADMALLSYIDDAEIRAAFEDVHRWYA